ncbi:MAG: AsmA family protein [Gammaproteobacteria bacterium]|nr:AsmA family protein [Gammaproteobacteria bacterium]
MKKALKILSIVIVAIAILFVIAVITVATLVNPNDFKGKISQIVYQQTGRQLTIAGDISWSFFPWVGVKVHDVSLSNAKGFSQQDFAKVGEADVSIRLLPLIVGKVEAGKLMLKDLDLALMRNKAGETNWQGLTSKPTSKPTKVSQTQKSDSLDAPDSDSKPGKSSKQMALVAISAIDVANANISWNDERAYQTAQIQHFSLQSKNVTLKKPFAVKAAFDFKTTNPNYSGHIAFNTKLTLNPQKQRYLLQDLDLKSQLKTPAVTKPLSLKITANVNLDLTAETFSTDNLSLQLNNFVAKGAVTGTQIITAPSYSGNLQIPTFDLKALLASLGQNIQTQNKDALGKCALQLNFQATPDVIKISSLQANLDQSKLNGTISKLDLKHKSLSFNLNLDQINFNHYKLKAVTKTNKKTGIRKSSSQQRAAKSSNKVASKSSSNAINGWNINGAAKIKQLTAAQLGVSNVSVKVDAKRGLINLNPVRARFYGGTLNSKIKVDLRRSTPKFSLNATLTNTNLKALLSDVANTNKISGIANISANLTTAGTDSNVMLRNLNGSGKVDIKNGALQGVNIPYLLQSASNLLHKQALPQKKSALNATSFGRLTGSFTIRNGLLSNNDLFMNAPDFQVKGQGKANLVNQRINYQLQAAKVENGQPTPLLVPINVTGTFTNLKIRPDLQYVVKQTVQQAAQQTIQDLSSGKSIKDVGSDLGKSLRGLFH